MIINRQTTAIVVDSTADLPESMAADPNVTMVPLTVFFGEEGFLDWVEIQPEEFYEKLAASPQLPRTSQPSAGAFLEEYKRLRQKYERVYSVHLSSRLSGTIASADVAKGRDRRGRGSRLRGSHLRRLSAGRQTPGAHGQGRVGRGVQEPTSSTSSRRSSCSSSPPLWTSLPRVVASARPSISWAPCSTSSRY